MSNIDWTMNCVLFGAKVRKLVEEGKDEEALEEIRNLTSELRDPYDTYLLERLKEAINDDTN